MIPTLQIGGLGRSRQPAATSGYTAETTTWETRIIALGGSVTTQEKDWADALITEIQAATFGTKIVALYPFLGNNIAAHRVPLRDSLGVGAATSTGFVNGDCSTAGGLNNAAGAAKYLDSGIKPSQLGPSNNGGLGWWERSYSGSGTYVEPMGTYGASAPPDERFVLDLRTSFQRFRWGGVSNAAGPATTTSSGFYYGQRSSATLRRIYKNGTTLGSDSTISDSAAKAVDQTIMVHGVKYTAGAKYPWAGIGGCALLTDGSLSDTDVSNLYTLLGTYLITPTGR